MKALLAIEWLKIKRYRTFWILVGFFLLLVPLWNYAIVEGMFKFGPDRKGGPSFTSPFQFSEVWGNVSYIASFMVWFLSILVIILVSNEYTFRTSRQNVIDGWRRLDFLHAKVILILLLALLATIFVGAVALVMGLSYSTYISSLLDGTRNLFYFFLLTVNYMGFALLITIWIKRSGLAIGLFILYAMIIENILKFWINYATGTAYANLLPLQSSDELLYFSPLRMAQAMMQQQQSTLADSTYVIASIVWCLIYYFTARRTLAKSDW